VEGCGSAFRLDSPAARLLEYPSTTFAFQEETMAPVSTQLLQALSQELSGIPVDPADLPAAASQIGAQLDGLARLDELDLLAVEPATVLLPPAEDRRADR
jgi:hypothetical protein